MSLGCRKGGTTVLWGAASAPACLGRGAPHPNLGFPPSPDPWYQKAAAQL